MKNTLEIDSIQKHFDNKMILSDVYLKCETTEIKVMWSKIVGDF